jgi:hypothetical protein
MLTTSVVKHSTLVAKDASAIRFDVESCYCVCPVRIAL